MSNEFSKFIGRQREIDQFCDSLNRFTRLGRLRARLAGRSGDPPRVFLPHGIGGMGKTWLAQKCLALARDKGWKTIELDWDMAGLRPNEPLDLMDAIAEALRDQYDDKTVNDYLEARGRARKARQKVERVKAENQEKWQELVSRARGVTEGWVDGAKGKAIGVLVQAVGAVVAAGASSLAHVEETFLNWAVGQGQLDQDDVLFYREGYTRLSNRLARVLVKAAQKKALVVLFDSCEVLPVQLEEWLRDAIVCPAVREQAPLFFIVAGRTNQFSERRQENAEGELITVKGYADLLANPPPVPWDMTRFAEPEVRDYLGAYGLSADDELVEQAQGISRGIPYALWVFVDTERQRGRETAQELFPLEELAGLPYKELVTRVTRRFLRHCLDQEIDRYRIYALALLRHPDPQAVAALWELPEGAAPRAELARLEARYAFVGIDGRLHDVVAEFARDELRYSERVQANQLGQWAVEYYGTRWQALTDAIPCLGDRLEDQTWRELTLDYLNGLLWQNGKDVRPFLAACFAEAMAFDWSLAHALLNLAAAFTTPQDWWPRQNHALWHILRRIQQADGLDEQGPLHLLVQSHELTLEAIQQVCLHFCRGQVLYATDRPLEALEACRESEALLPDDPTLRTKIADLYSRVGWKLCLVKGQTVPSNEAERAFRQATALQPDEGGFHIGLGVALHGLKRSAEGLSALEKGIELQGERASSLNGLGNVYRALKEYEAAIAAYQRAIQLDPAYASPHNGLGTVYSDLKEYEAAIAAYQRAIQLDPAYAYPHYNLGNVYRALKEYEAAIAAYQRAIQLDPDDASAYQGRGITRILVGYLDEAEADFLRVLELDPDEGWVYTSLANIYRHQGAKEQCAAYLVEARQRIPPDDDYARACLASIAGDADAAVAHLARALEQDPERSNWARQDPDFHWIRDDPRYRALVGEDVQDQ